LSHDQHPDNLDRRGRELTASAPVVYSTPAAAERMGGNVRGLAAWDAAELGDLRITAVPALHGPPGSEPLVGAVTGFVLSGKGLPIVYVSGDNVSLEVVREIAARCGPVDVAVIFAGGAQTALLGDAFLTLPSAGAAEAARIIGAPHVVPIHLEGWAHFTQGPDSVKAAFTEAGLSDRLQLLEPGSRFELNR